MIGEFCYNANGVVTAKSNPSPQKWHKSLRKNPFYLLSTAEVYFKKQAF